MKLPSIEQLRPLCADFAKEAHDYLTALGPRGFEPQETLRAFEAWAQEWDIFTSHGVEHVGDDAFDGELAYLNQGDSYDATLAYDTNTGEFLVTSWADWMEARENEHTEETGEQRCGYCSEWVDGEDKSTDGYCLSCARKELRRGMTAQCDKEARAIVCPESPLSHSDRLSMGLDRVLEVPEEETDASQAACRESARAAWEALQVYRNLVKAGAERLAEEWATRLLSRAGG